MIETFIRTGQYPSVLLFFGEEDLLVEEAAQQVFQAACDQDVSKMSTDLLDGEGFTLDAILSLARSFPMMSERRTLWVRRFEKVSGGKQKNVNAMSAYLANPMATTVLILSASLPSAAGIGALLQKNAAAAQRKIKALKYPFDVILTSATWQEYPAMKSSHVVPWIQKRAVALGMSLDPSLCDYLVAKHGTSLRELHMELDKLATFVGSSRQVTEDDIVQVVGESRAYSVFELQRAVGQGNLAQATIIIDRMLTANSQELLVIAMLTRYFTTLFKLIDARTLSGNNAIASAVGIPPFAVGEHIDALQRLGPQVVERAIHQLRYAESIIKSTATDPRILLQTVLLSILSPVVSGGDPVTLEQFSW